MKRSRIDFGQIFIPFFSIFFICFAYAFYRYVIVKGVDPIHIPLYLVNKVLGVTGVILIVMSYLSGPLAHAWPARFSELIIKRKYYGLTGFMSVLWHSAINFLTLTPGYHKKFFTGTEAGAKFTAFGELSIFFGLIGMIYLSFVALVSIPAVMQSMDSKQWRTIQRSGMLVLAATFMHLFFMGVKGWIKPSTWPSGLPPVTIISGGIIALFFIVRPAIILYGKSKHKTTGFQNELANTHHRHAHISSTSLPRDDHNNRNAS